MVRIIMFVAAAAAAAAEGTTGIGAAQPGPNAGRAAVA